MIQSQPLPRIGETRLETRPSAPLAATLPSAPSGSAPEQFRSRLTSKPLPRKSVVAESAPVLAAAALSPAVTSNDDRWHALLTTEQQTSAELRRQLGAIQQQLDVAESQLREVVNASNDLRLRHDSALTEAAKASSELSRLQSEIAAMRASALVTAAAAAAELGAVQGDLDAANAALRAQASALESGLHSSGARAAADAASIEMLASERDAARAALEEARKETAAALTRAENAESARGIAEALLSTSRGEYETQLAASSAAAAAAASSKHDLAGLLFKAQGELRDARAEVANLRSTQSAMETRYRELHGFLDTTVGELRTQLLAEKARQQAGSDARALLTAAVEDIARLTAERDSLAEAVASHRCPVGVRDAAAVDAELAAMREDCTRMLQARSIQLAETLQTHREQMHAMQETWRSERKLMDLKARVLERELAAVREGRVQGPPEASE